MGVEPHTLGSFCTMVLALATWINSMTDKNAGIFLQINVWVCVIYVIGLVPLYFPH